MVREFAYYIPTQSACPADWGVSPNEQTRSLLHKWGIQSPPPSERHISVESLENWYEKVHAPTAVKIMAKAAEPEDVHGQFIRLAREWIHGTEKHSNLMKIVMHPAYQQIIAMGPEVIPEILRLLTRGADHWFWALQALTQGQDPAEGTNTIDEAAAAWVRWGRERYDLD